MDDGPVSEPIHLVRIEGLRVETAEKDPTYSEEGIPEILTASKATLRLFGTGITKDTVITFTDIPQERGSICDKIKTKEFPVSRRMNNFFRVHQVDPHLDLIIIL